MPELLAAGVAPWRRPWKVAGILPTNLKSGKPYRGINVLVLALSGFASPYWLTFRQAVEQGGKVRAGAKGTQVVFWKFLRTLKCDEDGAISVSRDEAGRPMMTRIPLFRHYTVFNLEQVEGIETPKAVTRPRPSIRSAPRRKPSLRCRTGRRFGMAAGRRVTNPARTA